MYLLLIVDDSEMQRTTLNYLFTRYFNTTALTPKFEIQEAEDGITAETIIKALLTEKENVQHYTKIIIILDHNMPKQNGNETLEHIKRHYSEIEKDKLIWIRFTDDPEGLQGLRLFLKKPCLPSAVAQLFEDHLFDGIKNEASSVRSSTNNCSSFWQEKPRTPEPSDILPTSDGSTLKRKRTCKEEGSEEYQPQKRSNKLIGFSSF